RPVDSGDSFQLPVHCVLGNRFVRRSNLRCRPFEQRVRELARRVRRFRALPEFCLEFLRVLWTHLELKQHLHRVLARFGSQGHFIRAALSFSAQHSLPLRCSLLRVISSQAAPSRSLPVPPQILCFRPSVQRGQSPASGYPPSTRRKSPARPYPSVRAVVRARFPNKRTRNAPSLRESRIQSQSMRRTSRSAPASCSSAAIRTHPARELHPHLCSPLLRAPTRRVLPSASAP